MKQLNINSKRENKSQFPITLDTSVKEPVKERRQVKPNRARAANRVHPIFNPLLNIYKGGYKHDN